MIAKIVAGSPQDDFLKLYRHDPDEILIGVDIGANEIVRAGLKLDVAIGDFDNELVDKKTITLNAVELLTFPSEKDETDLELALRYVRDKHIPEALIYNATGGRIDHLLVALKLLEHFSEIHIRIIDALNEISMLEEGVTSLQKGDFTYASFFPLDEAVITLEGFKYPLMKRRIHRSDTYLVSNEITGKTGKVMIESGIVMLIKSR
jgi:thiamine pyrophosphokinase